jgi:hypothetical protein
MLSALALAGPDAEQSLFNRDKAPVELRLHAEVGFLAPLSHTIQNGQDGTDFNYVKDGGQDNLFPVLRFSTDLYLGKKRRHIVTFLYQPLVLKSEVTLQNDLQVDDTLFATGTPMNFKYGFSFWRASWMYDVMPSANNEFGLGLSLQIRNADIVYSSADGTQRQAYRNIGPVPVLKMRYRHDFKGNWFMGGEIDGFWAPIRLINGSNSDVEGAILDASFRSGYRLLRGVEAFINLRYLAGGAVGTNNNPSSGDGYTKNWLHFLTVSLGVSLR